IKMSAPTGGYGGGPRLGIRPDYADDQPGVLIGGVADGLPAARAGLRTGDRIVEMNGKEIKNLEGYMFFLRGQKEGATIEAGVMREGKKIMVKIKLNCRQRRLRPLGAQGGSPFWLPPPFAGEGEIRNSPSGLKSMGHVTTL